MATAPWDKRATETAEAWEAFVAFRDSGESLAKVAARLGKSKPLIERWSRQNKWADRRSAWTAAQDRAVTQARLKALGDTEEERQRLVLEMQNRHATVAMNMLSKVGKRLQGMSEAEIALMPAKDIARWVDVATKLEARARGVSQQVEVTGKDGGAIELDVNEAARQRVGSICGGILATAAASRMVAKPN